MFFVSNGDHSNKIHMVTGETFALWQDGVKGARFTLSHEIIAKSNKIYETIIFRH